MVALRSIASALRATAYKTLPLPEPWLPEVTSTQDALLVADHAQSPGVLTANAPVAASLPKSALRRKIVRADGGRTTLLRHGVGLVAHGQACAS